MHHAIAKLFLRRFSCYVLYLSMWRLILPSHLSIAFLWNYLKNASRLMTANEVENLHPAFPWQHQVLGLLLQLFNCALIDLIVWNSSRGQEPIWHAWHQRVRSNAHTFTRPEVVHGRWAASSKMGKETLSREETLQTGNCGRRTLSTWHPADLILLCRARVEPLFILICLSACHQCTGVAGGFVNFCELTEANKDNI